MLFVRNCWRRGCPIPWIPRSKYYDWPADAVDLYVSKLISLYEAGFAGAKHDPEALTRFRSEQTWPDGEAVAHQFGLAGTGAGKLVAPFVWVIETFPGCWPGPAQTRGDCVSHSTKNATLFTMVCDIVSGQPDETTGKPEEKPDVPEIGIQNGVLSTEAFYWWRGYDGDGWSCPDAANVATKISGCFLRKNYPELGVDLTVYSGKNAGLYGSRKPPENIRQVGSAHLVHQSTELQSVDTTRDFLYNGYGISTCGSEGFSSKRNEHGLSNREGSWSHALAFIAVDDRDVIKKIYGEPLVLVLNSWAVWDSGPRDIFQSAELVPSGKKELWTRIGLINSQTGNIMIPEGSFWAKWKDVSRREVIGFSGVNGWPRKNLPDFGTFVW